MPTRDCRSRIALGMIPERISCRELVLHFDAAYNHCGGQGWNSSKAIASKKGGDVEDLAVPSFP
jgi:hypothetical protein